MIFGTRLRKTIRLRIGNWRRGHCIGNGFGSPAKEQRLLTALRSKARALRLAPVEVERLAAVLYDAVYGIDRSRF
jgi:hypothetical protein